MSGWGLAREVVIAHAQGNLLFTDCGAATIIANVTYEGAITVDGKGRGGLLGFMTRLNTSSSYGIHVKDSNSIVASDYYFEGSDFGHKLEGNPGDQPGIVCISNTKCGLGVSTPDDTIVNQLLEVNNYAGQVFFGASGPYYDQRQWVTVRGDSPTFVCVFASLWNNIEMVPVVSGAGRLSLVGNKCLTAGTKGKRKDNVGDSYRAEDLAVIADGLDEFRRLGEADWRLNYGYKPEPATAK